MSATAALLPGATKGPLLAVNDLQIGLRRKGRTLHLVRDATFEISEGELVCLVGESGSGKTLIAQAIMGLAQERGLSVAGSISLAGQELVGLPASRYQALRGPHLAMVFQDPSASLDPVYSIGSQVAEAIRRSEQGAHGNKDRAIDLLRQVGIPEPRARMRQYPHELSGGLCQRVLIGMAIAGRPKLLVADEPTSALDVTIQAQILDLLDHMRHDLGMTILLITHDMGVAAIADRVIVLYAGSIAESGPASGLFAAPQHPYTAGLLASVPRLDDEGSDRLAAMPGAVPDPAALPSGCVFAPRCPRTSPRCAETPPLEPGLGGRRVACWHAGEFAEEPGALRLWTFASQAPASASRPRAAGAEGA
jgi:peptide/nickel transport system ATP-binding protein